MATKTVTLTDDAGTPRTFTVPADAVTTDHVHTTREAADATRERLGDPAIGLVTADDGQAWTLTFPPLPSRA